MNDGDTARVIDGESRVFGALAAPSARDDVAERRSEGRWQQSTCQRRHCNRRSINEIR
jgi:hypothetical protein